MACPVKPPETVNWTAPISPRGLALTSFMNIPLIKPDLPNLDEIRAPFEEILANGRITNFGKYMMQFETETGAYLGTQTAAVSSGTTGLIFTLAALGVQRGQKVILPSFTFMATAQAVLYAGGVPIFAEIDDDLTISADDLAQHIAVRDSILRVD